MEIGKTTMKTILSIAASDPSAGAGIQQDLKTITSLGHYGVTAITALTAQSTQGVADVLNVPTDFFHKELETLLEDVRVDAMKIGVVPNKDIAKIIASTIQQLHVPVVLDPILASTSGWRFNDEECEEYIKNIIFPLCTLVTPNMPEVLNLLKTSALTDAAVKALVERYAVSFLVKGGHAGGDEVCNTLYTTDGTSRVFRSPRIETRNLHGTGCTLSSAIACFLAEGLPLADSVERAEAVTHEGIKRGKDLDIGSGNGPLWMFPL